MRQPNSLVLLSTVAGISLVGAAGLPRGVGPEFVKFFESKDQFACIGHPATILKATQVNDGSCDCPDGSDEPGTAACAFLDPLSPPQPLPGTVSGTTNASNGLPGFWCENKGHVGTYVPFQYVNDGVCDYDLCCDGSEEYGKVGGVKCEDRCDSIGKEYRKLAEERRKSKEKSVKKRRTLTKEAKELRRQVEARVANLKSEIAQLTTKEKTLRKKFEEVEKAEKGKIVKSDGEGKGGKLGILVGLAKSRILELRDTLDKVLEQRDDYQDRVEELERILRAFKEEYNPNFNDEGVKTAVKGWEDYAAKNTEAKHSDLSESEVSSILKEDGADNGIDWSEFDEEDPSDADIIYSFEAYLPGFLKEFIHSKLVDMRVWMIENGLLADNPAGRGESRVVQAARDAADAAMNELNAQKTSLTNEEADLAKDYGTDGIFRALKGKCVSVEAGEYDYELCWMDKTMQKSKKGHGNTIMGNFEKLEIQEADEEDRVDGKGLGKGPRVVMRYENGQHCWNGPNRRTDVWLACAETDELWRVSESEKCVYRMEVGTPAVCEEDVIREPGAASGKDEL